MRMVLGCGSQHGRSADVDHLDAGRRLERVEVHHHQVDHSDAVGGQVNLMRGVVAVGQDAAMDARVQRHHSMPEHGRRAGVISRVDCRQTCGVECRGAAGAGDELPSQFHQTGGEIDQTGLVVDRDQRPPRRLTRSHRTVPANTKSPAAVTSAQLDTAKTPPPTEKQQRLKLAMHHQRPTRYRKDPAREVATAEALRASPTPSPAPQRLSA